MLNRDLVKKVFDKWEMGGLRPPIAAPSKSSKLIDEFLSRFRFMDEKAFLYVGNRVALGYAWPTFAVIEQLAKEYQDSHCDYVYIDFFKELKNKAYHKGESFDDFIKRIAEQRFPGKSEEWLRKYAFSIHFYGICVSACKDCNGVCPHNGHQYNLRLRKGSDVPIPWASADICEHYKESIDRDGRRHKRAEPSADDAWEGPPDWEEPAPEEAVEFKPKKKQAEQNIFEGLGDDCA